MNNRPVRWLPLLFCWAWTLAAGQAQEPNETAVPSHSLPAWQRERPTAAVLSDSIWVNRFADALETDRDSFTPSTRTVERGRWIAESSYSFIDHRRVYETHSFPELLLRFGWLERVELRLGFNYEVGGGGDPNSAFAQTESNEESTLERAHRLLYGFKAALTEQRGGLPESSVILQGFTPTGGPDTDTQFMSAYVFGWTMANKWKLDAALRYNTSALEEDDFGIWASSVVLRIPLGERWAVHGEYVGFFSQGKAEDFVKHLFTPGVHFLATPDVEVGVRLGWGLNDQTDRFFCNVGIGWRF